MSLEPGVRLGPYEVVAAAGAGGMGEVYKARDTRLDRTVAIKVLPAHVASDRQARERFEREARAVAALNHPHICTLHDVGRAEAVGGAVDFLVMEYVDGETLAARLQRGALPVDRALSYASEIHETCPRWRHMPRQLSTTSSRRAWPRTRTIAGRPRVTCSTR